MAKVIVPFDKRMLQLLMTHGNTCTGFKVEEGISPKANLQKAWIDQYGVLRFQFEDPEAEEEGEVQILWRFEDPSIQQPSFLFLIKDLKLAEVTHWGSSTRLRFTATKESGFEVKFDLPVSDLDITVPHEGPFFVACGEEKA